MSEHESFEDRLRAMADQVSQSMRRMSELDVEKFAERYGIDAERARGFADVAGQWLNDRMSHDEPFFAQDRHDDPDNPAGSMSTSSVVPGAGPGHPADRPGPHPLDPASDRQGLALSALDSGRWSVGPGSNELISTGEGPPPADAADLVSELRARDWITADGTLTLVGRHALGRWCRSPEDPAPLPPEPDDPPA